MNISLDGSLIQTGTRIHRGEGIINLTVHNCDPLSLTPAQAVQVAQNLLEAAASVEGQDVWRG